MAFNFQTFRTRALTSVVFVIVMLAGLFINNWTFFVLFSVIHFGCWSEYQKLIGLTDKEYQSAGPVHRYGVMILGWCFMMWMTNDEYWVGRAELRGIGWFVMMVLAVLLLAFEVVLKKQLNLKVVGYSVAGLVYISLSWGLMMGLRNETGVLEGTFLPPDAGWVIPVILIFSIWINDTMQYIVGSVFGKTPFSKISPKKTWEGTAGGSLLAVIVITFTGHFVFHTAYAPVIIISSIAAVLGTAGDLLESKLKRMAGVKDSGQIMPGHGGFLDRFDSLLLAVPFVWLYVHLLLR
jgi:phosphatidate cytidylyltransferase